MHSTPNTSPTSRLSILSGVRPYHKKILVGKLATFLEQEMCRICEANTWTIGALNMQVDHVHLFLNAPQCFTFTDRSHAQRHHRPQGLSMLPISEEILMGVVLSGPVRNPWAVLEI